MARTLLGAVVCSLFVAARCMYSARDDVVTLTASNFQREVVQSDSLWLVEFYAPWCGHCQRLTPDWKKAATALKGIVKVGAVDCDQHKALGGQYEIRGFPTIKIFGANKNKPDDYQGGRTSEAIVDGALNALRSLVKDRLSGRGGGGGGGGYDSGKQGYYREEQDMEYHNQQKKQRQHQQQRNPQGSQQHCQKNNPHGQQQHFQLNNLQGQQQQQCQKNNPQGRQQQQQQQCQKNNPQGRQQQCQKNNPQGQPQRGFQQQFGQRSRL